MRTHGEGPGAFAADPRRQRYRLRRARRKGVSRCALPCCARPCPAPASRLPGGHGGADGKGKHRATPCPADSERRMEQ